jgi:TolB-like protein/tetratricopeptide (TPR) repeat protein
MTEPSTPLPEERSESPPAGGASRSGTAASQGGTLWARIREHKVLQWSLAYLGAALALAHGQELVGHAFEWPEITNRIVIGALAVGFPVAVALAWYHGHKGLTRISAGEMTVVSVLLVIGAGLLMALVRTPAEQTEPQTNALRPVPAPAATLSTTGSPASTAAPIVTPVAATPRQHSIAVLPFVDMSEKKDQEYFADGMAEEITDLLARIPGITVMSRTSSFQFKGRNEDLRALGASLGVAYVLEGSVRKSGERVRVTAQLIDASDGSHRWSGSYDRDLVDVLKVQDEISWGLVRALEVSMGADESGSRPALRSVDAYALYLRGRQAYSRYDKEGYDQAASYFQQAMELDAQSALAPAWLALVNFNLAAYGLVQSDMGFEDARRYAERARMLDPKSELAISALGCIYVVHDWNWAAGQRELDRALALAPGSARMLLLHSLAPLALGHWDAALRDLNASVALDPLLPAAHLILGEALLGAAHWSEAEAALKRALDIAPSYAQAHFYLAEALLLKGEKQAALAQIDLESVETARWAGRAMIFHSMGRKTDSDAALKRLTELTFQPNLGYLIASVHAYRGETDAAFIWLERAFTQKDPALYRIKSSVFLSLLEADPRYKAFIRKMKLPE